MSVSPLKHLIRKESIYVTRSFAPKCKLWNKYQLVSQPQITSFIANPETNCATLQDHCVGVMKPSWHPTETKIVRSFGNMLIPALKLVPPLKHDDNSTVDSDQDKCQLFMNSLVVFSQWRTAHLFLSYLMSANHHLQPSPSLHQWCLTSYYS